MNATRVLDTSAWLLTVPLLPAVGELDFSVGLLTAAFTSTLGGPPIVTASSVHPDNRITYVPATGRAAAAFLIDLPNDRRTPFTIARPLTVFADIKWHPNPGRPAYNQPVARVELLILPSTDSAGIAAAGGVPVLTPATYYDDRILTTPIVVGPQGAPGTPLPIAPAGGAYQLVSVDGVLSWVEITAPLSIMTDTNGAVLTDTDGTPMRDAA